MFNYDKIDNFYFITSNKIKGKYGPFRGIYVKNKYYGDINQNNIDENKYPGYKYSIGVGKNKLFIVGLDGILDVLEMN